MFLKRVLSLAR